MKIKAVFSRIAVEHFSFAFARPMTQMNIFRDALEKVFMPPRSGEVLSISTNSPERGTYVAFSLSSLLSLSVKVFLSF